MLQDIRHPRVKTIMSRRFDFAKRIGCGESVVTAVGSCCVTWQTAPSALDASFVTC
jgi:hypothetical protein